MASRMLTLSNKARQVFSKASDSSRHFHVSRWKTKKIYRCEVSLTFSLTSARARFPSRCASSQESSTATAKCTSPSPSIWDRTTTSTASSTPSRSPKHGHKRHKKRKIEVQSSSSSLLRRKLDSFCAFCAFLRLRQFHVGH